MRTIVAITICVLTLGSVPSWAEETYNIPLKQVEMKPDANMFYEPSLRPAAERLADQYPMVLNDTQTALGVHSDLNGLSVHLLKEKTFGIISRGRPVMALAFPDRKSIIMDYDALGADPLVMRATLRHEVAHLLIHEAAGNTLPKWLNEGIAQWASGGHSEIRMTSESWTVTWAANARRLIPLNALSRSFPSDKQGMALAYKQSLSAVDFMVSIGGERAVKEMLGMISSGMDAEKAFASLTGHGYDGFSALWKDRILKRSAIKLFIREHLYESMFALAGIALFLAFMRVLYRIKTYKDPEDEQPPTEHIEVDKIER